MVEKVKTLMASGEIRPGNIHAVFVPVSVYYNKPSLTEDVLPNSDMRRVAMLQIGIAELLPPTPFVNGPTTYSVSYGVSTYEQRVGASLKRGISTWESLQQFEKLQPGVTTIFGQGYDNVASILRGSWARPDILLNYPLLVVERGNLVDEPNTPPKPAIEGLVQGTGNVARLKIKINLNEINAKIPIPALKFGDVADIIALMDRNFKNTTLPEAVAEGLKEVSSSTIRALLRAARIAPADTQVVIAEKLDTLTLRSITDYCIANALYSSVTPVFDMRMYPGAASPGATGEQLKEVTNFNNECSAVGLPPTPAPSPAPKGGGRRRSNKSKKSKKLKQSHKRRRI
jgi:hypothetical protein